MFLGSAPTLRTASIDTPSRGTAAVDEVTELIAPLLGWDGEKTESERQHYRARVEAERQSQQQSDDQTAESARLGAPEVRAGLRQTDATG